MVAIVDSEKRLKKAAVNFRTAQCCIALTGAGISVDCGIPDFRSRGGLWSRFDPDEYAAFNTFIKAPEKAWRMYRELGRTITGKTPGRAHRALVQLEQASFLHGVITQNIDGLHEAAGSEAVAEVHGNFKKLTCLECGDSVAFSEDYLKEGTPPCCGRCKEPLKPDVVLFGELVRDLGRVEGWLKSCDLLMMIGTSATVYPVAGFPLKVLGQGGSVYEFNLEETEITEICDYSFPGRTEKTVSAFVSCVLG